MGRAHEALPLTKISGGTWNPVQDHFFEVREEILISLRNIHLWPLIHYRTVCTEFSGYDTLCVRHNETGTCGPQQHSHLDLTKGSTDGLLPSTPNSVQRLHW